MTASPQPDSGRSSATLLHYAKTALLYEELRSAIDGGHESMTHADALAEISAIRAENETLHAGYAAARLEIELLRARSAEPGAALATQGATTDEVDVPHQCPYFGPSPHRDVWLAGWYAARAALVSQQPAPTPQADSVTASSWASHEKELEDALRERDESDEFIDTLLDEVLGADRAEWSSAYGRADALNDVQERMTTLHKPTVDKA